MFVVYIHLLELQTLRQVSGKEIVVVVVVEIVVIVVEVIVVIVVEVIVVD